MAVTGKLRVSFVAGGVNFDVEQNLSQESLTCIEVSVDGTTTDEEIICPIDVSQMQMLIIHSDQDLTLETNDGGSPDDTIVLAGGVPLIWQRDTTVDGSVVDVLDADVTAIYATNSGEAAASLKIYVLSDATP